MNDKPLLVEAVRPHYKTSPCRGCGRPIVWAKSPDGSKKYPLDPRAPVFEVSGVDPVLIAKISPTAYVSHFATCPNADEFSKSKRTE